MQSTPDTAVKTLSESIVNQIEALKQSLKAYILSLPDFAEGVKPICKNCCVVDSLTVFKNGGVWSPSYYINTETKQILLELLDKTGIENLNKKIEDMIITGRLQDGEHQSILLNPAFVSAIEDLWFGKNKLRRNHVRAQKK
jgi:hypothetical protein